MKTTHLLATVAAALLLNAGAASAQGMGNKSEGAAQAPAAQQKAPAEKQSPAMKQGAGDQKGAAEHRAGNKPAETTGQATDKDKGGAMHKGADSKSSDTKASDSKSSDTMKKGNEAQKTPDAKDTKSGSQAQSPSSTHQNNAQGQTGTKSNQSSSSSTTTQQNQTSGQGVATGANISTEQRTKITSVIKQQKVQRVDKAKLNVEIRVGARIPESVHFYPLPAQVVEVYPAWRGFDYILVGDEILVINPRTHEIVAVLEA